ncbi:hypothetical protein FHG87_005885 [Trinorchestia longiramus]|nr:hypothetical protein FHG87_005885 [Trinorchestia longiramus]
MLNAITNDSPCKAAEINQTHNFRLQKIDDRQRTEKRYAHLIPTLHRGSPKIGVASFVLRYLHCQTSTQLNTGRRVHYDDRVSQSGPYRPPGGVEEMQGGGRRVRLEWGAYITV